MKIVDILDYRVFRFAIVGIASNGVLFLAYLGLTAFGMGSKFAMTLLYIIGVLQGFVFNKKWTFSHDGYVMKTFIAYVLLYGIGYLANLVILVIFVDKIGVPHQWVQGATTLFLAGCFFLIQRFFIFKVAKPPQARMI